MSRYHFYRSIYGNWVQCECDTPFDSHSVISYDTVPILSKRLPATPFDSHDIISYNDVPILPKRSAVIKEAI